MNRFAFCVVCAGRSNTRGDEFVLYDNGVDPNENADPTPIRKELCAVTYVSGGWSYLWMNVKFWCCCYVDVDVNHARDNPKSTKNHVHVHLFGPRAAKKGSFPGK